MTHDYLPFSSHTLCVTGQLAFAAGGGQGKVIYLDTEGNFRSERIEAIAHRFGLDALQTLDNVMYNYAYMLSTSRTINF